MQLDSFPHRARAMSAQLRFPQWEGSQKRRAEGFSSFLLWGMSIQSRASSSPISRTLIPLISVHLLNLSCRPSSRQQSGPQHNRCFQTLQFRPGQLDFEFRRKVIPFRRLTLDPRPRVASSGLPWTSWWTFCRTCVLPKIPFSIALHPLDHCNPPAYHSPKIR